MCRLPIFFIAWVAYEYTTDGVTVDQLEPYEQDLENAMATVCEVEVALCDVYFTQVKSVFFQFIVVFVLWFVVKTF